MHSDTSIKLDIEREWSSFHANRRAVGLDVSVGQVVSISQVSFVAELEAISGE